MAARRWRVLAAANDKGVGLDAAGGQSRTTGGLCHTGSK